MKIPSKISLTSIFSKATIILAFAALLSSSKALAVSGQEMEQARAIAAKYYIRFMNNGAGYLDNWEPSSMGDLEGKLANDKDRESLKQFKSASSPGDYASWDKEKLVSYWSSSFFADNASKLDSKAANNGLARKQIKNALSAMKVAPPAATPPADEVQTPPEPSPEPIAEPQPEPQEVVDDQLAQLEDSIQATEDQMEEEQAQEPEEKKSSGTWVYILVLAILVVVVIMLVLYASRTMKGNPQPSKSRDREPAPQPQVKTRTVTVIEQDVPEERIEVRQRSYSDDSRMREKYAESLAAKSEEIRVLTHQLAEMEALCDQLKEENRQLTVELEKQRSGHDYHKAYMPAQERHTTPSPRSDVYEVYLGRVNANGVFVRADRHPVEGQSIYKLTTSNGVSGTFTVVSNPATERIMLDDPGKWLAGGCFAKDIFDTEGRYNVHTETPGTAVFRDGAWRVERKAKISYD